jgi:hypothetical protein
MWCKGTNNNLNNLLLFEKSTKYGRFCQSVSSVCVGTVLAVMSAERLNSNIK